MSEEPNIPATSPILPSRFVTVGTNRASHDGDFVALLGPGEPLPEVGQKIEGYEVLKVELVQGQAFVTYRRNWGDVGKAMRVELPPIDPPLEALEKWRQEAPEWTQRRWAIGFLHGSFRCELRHQPDGGDFYEVMKAALTIPEAVHLALEEFKRAQQ